MPDYYKKDADGNYTLVDSGGSSGPYGPQSTIGFEAPWVEQYRRGFFDNLTNLVRDPMPTPQRGVASFDPFELKARSLSSGLGGFQPYMQQAGGAYGRGVGALGQGVQAGYAGAQGYDPNMGKAFYNPYEDQVVQRSLDDVYKNFSQADMGARASEVGAGAYGGGRGRLMANERFNQLGRGMSDTAGQLRSQGYNNAQSQAQNAFDSQQQRMQQAGAQGMQGAQMYGSLGQGIAGLGGTGQQLLRNQMATLGGLGAQGRGIQDDMYGSQFDAANSLAKEPYQRMQFLGSMLQSLLPKGPTTGISTLYNSPDSKSENPWDIIADLLKDL